MVGCKAYAGDREQLLGNECAGEESGQGAAEDGDDGDEGVSEGVMIYDLSLGKTLCSCGPYVVGVENFEHIGSRVSHKRAHADDDQRDDRHHEVVCIVKYLSARTEHIVLTSRKSEQVKPAELYGEHEL